jgi:hypothetical protein
MATAKKEQEQELRACDVVVIGPNTALPEGIDAQQLTVSSSFIIEVIKERLPGKIPSAESFPFVEP